MNQPSTTPSKNSNERFLQESLGFDALLAVVEWAAWKALAITTAITVYAILENTLAEQLTGLALIMARATGIFLLYLVIDYGLQKMFAYYITEKHQLEKEKEQMEEETLNYRKAFLNIVFYCLIFRVVMTLTSSIWGAPDASQYITKDSNHQYYAAAILQTDSLSRQRQSEVQQLATTLSETEASRVKQAKAKGKVLFSAAYATGDRWQRSSYDEEGFGWLENRNNRDANDHAYAKRLRDAQRQAEELIQAEYDKTKQGNEQVINSVQDTTTAKAIAVFSTLGKEEVAQYKETVTRRTNYLYLIDIALLVIAGFCTRMRVVRRLAANAPLSQLSLTTTLIKAKNKNWSRLLHYIEKQLKVDIDGDGWVGAPEVNEGPQMTGGNADVGRLEGAMSEHSSIGIPGVLMTADAPPPYSRNPIGFFRNNETPLTAKTDETLGLAHPHETSETVGEQGVQDETAATKQAVAPEMKQAGTSETDQAKQSGTREIKHTETVVIVDVSERYLRSRIKQSYKRSKSQADPATPLLNYQKFSKQLKALGYTIEEVTKDGKPDLKLTKGEKVY